MRTFFALLIAAAAAAVWFEAPLSWDGAYLLFRLLDDGTPAVPFLRLSHAAFQLPVLIARYAGIEDPRILGASFSLTYALVPAVSLALSWWIVRGRREELFVWPALSIALSNLPGVFFMSSEGPVAIELFWPIVLALLVGSVTRGRLAALVVAALLGLFAHPIAGLVAAACAILAFVQTGRGRLGPARARGWLVGAVFLTVAAARLLAPLSGYEKQQLTVRSFLDPLRAATWGWPRVSLGATLAAAFLTALQALVWRRLASPLWRKTLAFAPALLALAAGLFMIPWARDPNRWASALNYRFVMNALSAVFLTAAALEGLAARSGSLADGGEIGRGRRITAVMAALSLLVLFAVQGASWSDLRTRFAAEIAAARAPCVPLTTVPSVGRTALRHWSSTALSIVLQGRRPARVAMPDEGCEDLARTGAWRIAPFDLRERAGWFVLPK